MLRPAIARKANLQGMTQQELIARITELERRVLALSRKDQPKKGQQSTRRTFNFREHPQRRIALKIAYFGWDYHGFATQENNPDTVEEHLFNALHTARLIEDRVSADYNRCGRTDKGVSALSQVVALNVRSELPVDHPDAILIASDGEVKSKYNMTEWQDYRHEIPYHHILNRILPPDIRVLSWCPVPKTFSARFDCRTRKYKYFFAQEQLDIEAMKTAANYLIGAYDFRNFCKVDKTKGKQQTFCRTIQESYLEDLGSGWWCYNVKGSAFLWHQVRSFMALLFMIGQGKESPDLIQKMLDIELVPEKPQYLLASELPLVLWDCEYDPPIHFTNNIYEHDEIMNDVREFWKEHAVKSFMAEKLLSNLLTHGHSSAVRTPPDSVPPAQELKRFGKPNLTPEEWLEKRNAAFGDKTVVKWEEAEAFFRQFGVPTYDRPNSSHFREKVHRKLLESDNGCHPLHMRLALCDERIAKKRQRMETSGGTSTSGVDATEDPEK